MCYHGKCFMCIPVETGSFICAIIITVLTASTLLISFVLGCFTATGQLFGQYIGSYGYIPNGGVTTAFYLLAATALAGLVFAILLCRGISKRRPSFIKAYFIYGVVLTAVTVVVAVGMLLGGFQIVSVFLLVSCVIYSLFLVLVQKAYFKILEGGENGTVLKQNQNQLIE